MLLKSEKIKIVKEIRDKTLAALDGAIADYRGTDVSAMTELRNNARHNNIYLKIARNTLIKRALVDTSYSCLESTLEGPSLLGLSLKEPGATARLFRDFVKENPNFIVKGLAANGEFINADKIALLANLPTRDEAIARVAMTFKAPVQQLATALNQIPCKVAHVLNAVSGIK